MITDPVAFNAMLAAWDAETPERALTDAEIEAGLAEWLKGE
jgi:hypothetical protein